MSTKQRVLAKTASRRGSAAGKTRGKRSANLSVSKTYKLYINGKFPRTESGRYFKVEKKGDVLANVCQGSRKDFREAMVAARAAQKSWAKSSAYLRGQIIYRVAEMLEGRQAQFIGELVDQGSSAAQARAEVQRSIDCLVHYAGWSDKYQQIFSAVNPVASSHFNFSMPEPTGVVAVLAPQRNGLLGLVANLVPAVLGGNTAVVLSSEAAPLSGISFAEVLNSSDVPPGVVNILTGFADELTEHMAAHMDVNAIVYCGTNKKRILEIETLASNNVKRVVIRPRLETSGPYMIKDTLEIKTTWHPVGG